MGAPLDLRQALRLQPGDNLRLSAEPVETEVVRLDSHYYFLRTPWAEVDPDSGYRWDGSFALPRDDDTHEWANIPWRLVEEPSGIGSTCRIYIPPTRVTVRRLRRHRTPLDTGSLPRPSLTVHVCPDHLLTVEGAGYGIEFDTNEPIKIERIGT